MIKHPNCRVKSISPPQCKGQYVRVTRPSFSPVFHFSSVSASGNRSLFRPAVQGYINAARPCTAKQNSNRVKSRGNTLHVLTGTPLCNASNYVHDLHHETNNQHQTEVVFAGHQSTSGRAYASERLSHTSWPYHVNITSHTLLS